MILHKHLPRIITGICLLLVLGAALCLSGLYLFCLLAVFALLGLHEFYNMFSRDILHIADTASGLIIAAVFLCGIFLLPRHHEAVCLAVALLFCLQYLFAWSRRPQHHFVNSALLIAGFLYVPLLLSPALQFKTEEQIFLIAAAVISDTAAYFGGICFGRHLIWPKVSPKKTVEGSLCGWVGCILICSFFGYFFGTASFGTFVLLTACLGIMSQLGDFFESALKRSCGVKDSGTILPGHGGILDRIDSLLFIIPTYAVARTFVQFF
ncbi:MAG: phosphatidate cytidylyltransferase [Desulfovibrionaceae bacterium]|nr:phosphatidate cytidylyltransferase [Desulfovibrionaceae bacterium]